MAKKRPIDRSKETYTYVQKRPTHVWRPSDPWDSRGHVLETSRRDIDTSKETYTCVQKRPTHVWRPSDPRDSRGLVLETSKKIYLDTSQKVHEQDIDTSKETDIHVQALEKIVASFKTLQKRPRHVKRDTQKRSTDVRKNVIVPQTLEKVVATF